MAFQGARKGPECYQTLRLPSAPLPEGGGVDGPRSGRAGAEAAAAASASAVRAGEWRGRAGMERQRWLPLEANPEVSAAQISVWGPRRGEGNRAAIASPGWFVSKSCSLFRFQVTNQVSEVSRRSGLRSPPWPSIPPRPLGVWDLIP